MCQAELKIFASLEHGCDFNFAKDDIYGMVQVTAKQIQPYIMLTKHQGHQQSLIDDPHTTWVEDFAIEMLETLYFDWEMLHSKPAALLAASLVLASLYILS